MFTKVEFRELAQAVAMFNNSTAVAADREPIIEESSVTIEADEGSSSGAAAAVVFKGVSNREYFSLLLPLFLSSLLWVL